MKRKAHSLTSVTFKKKVLQCYRSVLVIKLLYLQRYHTFIIMLTWRELTKFKGLSSCMSVWSLTEWKSSSSPTRGFKKPDSYSGPLQRPQRCQIYNQVKSTCRLLPGTSASGQLAREIPLGRIRTSRNYPREENASWVALYASACENPLQINYV